MNWLKAKWNNLEQDPFWGIVIVAVFALVTLGEALGGMPHLRDELGHLISNAATFDQATGKATLTNLSGWIAVLVIFLLVILMLVGLRIRNDRDELRKSLNHINSEILKDQKTIERTFEKMMSAAAKICSQLFPTDARPQKNILATHVVFLVDENFNATVSCDWEYKAVNDLYFEQFNVGSESDADPCKYLNDIDFKIWDANPLNSIAYLPTENSAYSKRVVAFFLPHIKPAEPIARTICMRYRWPGMMKRLRNKGSEVGSWLLLSRDPVPIAETSVYFAPAIKDKIEASISGPRLGDDHEKCERSICELVGYTGWAGWRYKLTNVPPGEYKVEFTYKP
jgi:hypothetical protein